MLLTNIKFAIRVFLKDKFFSTLNILGLALGIAVSIILLLILQYDLNYDKYNVNYSRIYRLGSHLEATGVDFRAARSARELGIILKEEFPEIEEVVRANSWGHTLVKYTPKNGKEIAFYEEDIVRTDSNYFKVFTNEFISGNPNTALTELHTVVITASTAKRYFGNENPLDESLFIGDDLWKVTGVIKDLPGNTHLKFNFLLSRLIDREGLIKDGEPISEAFWNPDVYTYLLVKNQYDTQAFYSKFPAIYDKYFKSFGDQVGGKYTPILQPLADIHFYSNLSRDEAHGNIAYLYAFTGTGLFIIILACINYMNLSTAKAVGRATEIAMKKTLGSGKRAMMFSFLGESVLLSTLSLLVAILLVFLMLSISSFRQLIGKDLALDFFGNPTLLIGTLSITIGIGIISGLYPALYLPSIPTIKALKGGFKNRKSSHMLRRVLITTQFAISIFVVVCTLFMQDQIRYVRNKDLGFNKENVLLLPIQDTTVQNHIKAIKNDFLQNPHILAATTSYNVLGTGIGGPVMWAESESGMKQQAFAMINIGDDYFKTMNVKLIAGRDFEPDANENKFIINEATAKLMGWGSDPIGKKIKWFHAEKPGEVIGMVKDFNFKSLHNAVEPLLIVKPSQEGGFLHLKVSGDELPETIEFLREKWSQLDPSHPFEYAFLDQRFDEQYKSDEVQFKLVSSFSYICIFISLLGLLGLSAFTAAQRTKEIGIRKVHGANIPQIIYLLYKDIMYLVIVATILVAPAAYYVMYQWLGNFAYQVTLNFLMFGLVGLMALVFAFFTVAFHSLKTASTNPVVSLKYE